jgi:glycosidase
LLRLDAIAYLWKEIGTPCIHLPQTHAVVKLMRAVLDQVAPGVRLITETNVPHEDNISYFGDGSDEAQLVYNFALPPLVLHTLQTGSAAKLSRWAGTLRLSSDRVTFLNFLASHDGIGLNPVRGILTEPEIEGLVERAVERGGIVSYKRNADGSQSPYELNINYLDALSGPGEGSQVIATQLNRFLTSQAIMLSLAGIPGIYFHSLFGSRGDRAGAEASGIPRRINREKSSRAGLERDLADAGSLRARILAGYARLLRVRRSFSAFHPGGRQEILPNDDRVFAVLRLAPDGRERVLCLHNVTGAPVLFSANGAKGERWTDLIDGEPCAEGIDSSTEFALQPYQTLWASPLLIH